jgi:hypothetical protein
MRRPLFSSAACIAVCFFLLSCQSAPGAKPTTANAAEAMSKAGNLSTTGEKVDFLIKETKAFIEAGKVDDAARLAEHVIELDPANEEARRLARKAYEKTMGSMVGN